MKRSLLIVVLGTGLFGSNSYPMSEAEEKVAILAVTEKAFQAVASRNPDDWRAIQMAEGTTLSMRPDGAGGQTLRIRRNEDSVSGMSPDGRRYLERWIGQPVVRIRGPIATVWGEYEFLIDGAFSHCGVDAVDLVKLDGEWKIANFMWTVEREGCEAVRSPK